MKQEHDLNEYERGMLDGADQILEQDEPLRQAARKAHEAAAELLSLLEGHRDPEVLAAMFKLGGLIKGLP